MERAPLMPKATAVWLVDNTSLTFDQIAEFCWLHVLEVKGIADGDVAHGIKGMDPISSGQLSREEIAAAEDDSSHRLKLSEPKVEVPEVKTKRGPRYTPVSRRQDRPNAILWLLQEPSRAEGLADHASGRHHQADHHRHPRAPALELAQPSGAGPGDARALLADRPRCRGEEGGVARSSASGRRPASSSRPRPARCCPPRRRSPTRSPAPEPERPMATALAQEARAAMNAPDEEEETPDIDFVFAKLKDLKRTDVTSD